MVPPLLPKLQERCSLCCHRKNLIDHSLKGANCPCLRNQLHALLLLLTSLCFHTAEKHFLVLLSDCTSASSLIGFCVHIQQGTNVLRAGEKQQHLFSIQSLRAAPQELFFPFEEQLRARNEHAQVTRMKSSPDCIYETIFKYSMSRSSTEISGGAKVLMWSCV